MRPFCALLLPRFVALKVLVGAFGDAASAQRAYREVAYLQVLCGHPNIARLRAVYCAETGRDVVLTSDSQGRALPCASLSPSTVGVVEPDHMGVKKNASTLREPSKRGGRSSRRASEEILSRPPGSRPRT